MIDLCSLSTNIQILGFFLFLVTITIIYPCTISLPNTFKEEWQDIMKKQTNKTMDLGDDLYPRSAS